MPDIDHALAVIDPATDDVPNFDEDYVLPGGLWNPETNAVAGGVNWGTDTDDKRRS